VSLQKTKNLINLGMNGSTSVKSSASQGKLIMLGSGSGGKPPILSNKGSSKGSLKVKERSLSKVVTGFDDQHGAKRNTISKAHIQMTKSTSVILDMKPQSTFSKAEKIVSTSSNNEKTTHSPKGMDRSHLSSVIETQQETSFCQNADQDIYSFSTVHQENSCIMRE
jgi:hypothetical protein